jgi:hypothetical protein
VVIDDHHDLIGLWGHVVEQAGSDCGWVRERPSSAIQAVDPLGPNAGLVEIRLPRYPLLKDRTRSALFIDYVLAQRIVVRSFRKDQ